MPKTDQIVSARTENPACPHVHHGMYCARRTDTRAIDTDSDFPMF